MTRPPLQLWATPVIERLAIDHVGVGQSTLVRSIFATVRDENWNTISPRVESHTLTRREDGFELRISADASPQAPVKIWVGAQLTGRLLKVDFRAQSVGNFRTNRLGLCVLHPSSMAGRLVRLVHTDQSTSGSAFPITLSPHQPFRNLTAMTFEADGVRTTLRFAGDIFETEDQRNWIDDSFKTYCTPLGQPLPRTLRTGDTVEQSVQLEVDPVCRGFPGVGVMVNQLPQDSQIESLRELGVDHIRFDLNACTADQFARVLRCRTMINCDLIVAVYDVENHPQLIELVKQHGDVIRWLIAFGSDRRVPSRHVARRVRDLGWTGQLAIGSDSNFTELHRHAHDVDLELVDAVSFAANPQVHAFDDESILETPRGLAACVGQARWLFDRPVLVSPLTLRRRFNAVATSGSASIDDIDPRQGGELAASWLRASLAACAQAGAALVTIFEAVGPRGVITQTGQLTPAYHTLGRLIQEQHA